MANTEEAEAISGTAAAVEGAEETVELTSGQRPESTDIVQLLKPRFCNVLAHGGCHVNLHRGGIRYVPMLVEVSSSPIRPHIPPLVTAQTRGERLPLDVEAAVETALWSASESHNLWSLVELMSARCDYPNRGILVVEGTIPHNNEASARRCHRRHTLFHCLAVPRW